MAATLMVACTPEVAPIADSGTPTGDSGSPDDGSPDDPDGGVVVPETCGDGVLIATEGCDDGNTESGDGCTAACDAIEPYYQCRVPGQPCTRVPFDEVLEAGLDQYIGNIPAATASSEDGDDVTTYTWSGDDRPRCMQGEFVVTTRERASNDLVIVLGGGGVCLRDQPIFTTPIGWALRVVTPNGDLCNQTAAPSARSTGIFDYDNPENPFFEWSGAFLPNCDGSVWVGDTEDRPGLYNLTAALEVLKSQFPNPDRIVLSGVSAGAFGLLAGMPILRSLYPDSQVFVVGDAALAVGTPVYPDFLRDTVETFNIGHIVDAACDVVADTTDCEEDGYPHLSWMYDYALREDDNMTVAGITSDEDIVIGGFFLALYEFRFRLFPPGLEMVVPRYKQALEDALTPVADAHPGRFEAFIYEGHQHTILTQTAQDPGFTIVLEVLLDVIGLGAIGDFTFDRRESMYTLETEGVVLVDWLQAMVDGTDDFESVVTY